MDMVAASKLQKARVRMEAARIFFGEAKRMIDELNVPAKILEHEFFLSREIKNTAYVVFTGDRGLCGSYNANVSAFALSHMNDESKNEKIFAAGLKGADFFRRKNKNVVERYPGLSERTGYCDIKTVGERLVSMYHSGEIDEAYAVYTHFKSALSYVPRVAKILPLEKPQGEFDKGGMKYEPDASLFLDQGISVYVNALLYNALTESSACEQAARMFCMDAAVNNASEIIEKLTRQYNRKRQAIITQEISEIVGSTNTVTKGR